MNASSRVSLSSKPTHIPLLVRPEAFAAAVRIGRILMELHVGYEQ